MLIHRQQHKSTMWQQKFIGDTVFQSILSTSPVRQTTCPSACSEMHGYWHMCASCYQCSRTPKPSTSTHWPRAANMHTQLNCIRTDTHIPFNALCPGLPRWAGTRKVKPICIFVKQETVSGSGISWAICKSAPRSRMITTPTPHRSVFYRPDALPAAQPTASKHWRQMYMYRGRYY